MFGRLRVAAFQTFPHAFQLFINSNRLIGEGSCTVFGVRCSFRRLPSITFFDCPLGRTNVSTEPFCPYKKSRHEKSKSSSILFPSHTDCGRYIHTKLTKLQTKKSKKTCINHRKSFLTGPNYTSITHNRKIISVSNSRAINT